MTTVIDADTHICEPAAMWESIEGPMRARRPVMTSVGTDTLYGRRNAFWLIDGNIWPKPAGRGGISMATPCQTDFGLARTDIEVACREITDAKARVQHMDQLQVDVQVVFPTLFLAYLTDDPELDLALCRAYNRFLGQAYAESGGRIRWVVLPPLRNSQAVADELRWAKEHGAVGVFTRGIERDRTMDDPSFFPLYEEAQKLDLPICIHTAAGCP